MTPSLRSVAFVFVCTPRSYMLRGYLPSEVRYYPAQATGVDFESKIVRCASVHEGEGKGPKGFALSYDKLVIAIGSDVSTFGTKVRVTAEVQCIYIYCQWCGACGPCVALICLLGGRACMRTACS